MIANLEMVIHASDYTNPLWLSVPFPKISIARECEDGWIVINTPHNYIMSHRSYKLPPNVRLQKYAMALVSHR